MNMIDVIDRNGRTCNCRLIVGHNKTDDPGRTRQRALAYVVEEYGLSEADCTGIGDEHGFCVYFYVPQPQPRRITDGPNLKTQHG